MADDLGARVERLGERVAGSHDESKWAILTTEFWTMVVLIVLILLAAAVSDALQAGRAWTLIAVVGAAFILSRGIAKAGRSHIPPLPGRSDEMP